jgi:uncharacterized protein YcbK (DUF882 family)
MSDKITPHFTWSEATRSATARKLDLDNTPTRAARDKIKTAAFGMEAVRSLLGVPLDVTSWYRAPAVNKAVGGSPTSDHVTGWAVDFRARGRDAKACALNIAASPLLFDQLIWYPNQNRLHISFNPQMRNQVMTRDTSAPSGYVTGIVG